MVAKRRKSTNLQKHEMCKKKNPPPNFLQSIIYKAKK